MLEGQVAFYLNKYLGSYVYGLDPQSLKISVFKGDVQLNNLHLKPDALNALGLPITVKAGLLGSLTLKVGFMASPFSMHTPVATVAALGRPKHCMLLQVPWASLGRAPVLVELDRLYLLAGPKEEFEEQDSDLEQVHTARQPACNKAGLQSIPVLGVQDFEEAEQQAKEKRVADAELVATQVLQLLMFTCSCTCLSGIWFKA